MPCALFVDLVDARDVWRGVRCAVFALWSVMCSVQCVMCSMYCVACGV